MRFMFMRRTVKGLWKNIKDTVKENHRNSSKGALQDRWTNPSRTGYWWPAKNWEPTTLGRYPRWWSCGQFSICCWRLLHGNMTSINTANYCRRVPVFIELHLVRWSGQQHLGTWCNSSSVRYYFALFLHCSEIWFCRLSWTSTAWRWRLLY